MKTAIIYARVSTPRQAEEGLPMESQMEQCRVKAAALGARVVRVFRDDGLSGRSSKRPGLIAAFDYCEAAKIDYFVCWSTSRFARNRLDAALNKRLLDKMGVKLAYASQEFGEGDDGWLSEAITEVIDEQFSRQIAKDTRRSMAKNAADGNWNGGHEPFGFEAVADGKRRRLSPRAAEVPTLRMIFDWCIAGAGCKDIAVRLNQMGISKRGLPWSKAHVSSALKCPAAIGQISFRGGGAVIVTDAHNAVIEEETFMEAQRLMASRAPRNSGGTPRSEAVFSGMLRCSCGDAMTTESATGRGGQRYRYYNCRAWLKGIGCRSHRLPVNDLDPWLLDKILDKVFTAENLRQILLDLKQTASTWVREHEARLQSMYGEAEDIDRRLRRLYESVEAGKGLALSDVAPRLRELNARKTALTQEIAAAEMQVAPQVDLTAAEIDGAAEVFRGIVLGAEPAKVRAFLSPIVRRVVVDSQEARIEYFPERIVAALGGSHCVERWLPDLATLRTAIIPLGGYRTGRRSA